MSVLGEKHRYIQQYLIRPEQSISSENNNRPALYIKKIKVIIL